MQVDKLLSRMRANPKGDWTIDDLITLARRHGIEFVLPTGGSHRIFRYQDGSILSVPAKRPVKPHYIKAFVSRLSSQEQNRS
ncbi:MAG: type II toxin-antitoxin system HicA family toxin [Burkholderiales bacterium]|nr:type II toxin-antitoxin system HicA family toxin [Burkholderiales bacterium]